MRNAAAMLYCPNPTCQAPNSEDQKFCQKCSTLLPRHYLWALGEESTHQPGALIAERYLCKQPRVFLDTKPGQLSHTYQELPEPLLPYLRLTSYQLHVPQIYDWIPAQGANPALVLLDQVPLCAASEKMAQANAIQLLPSIGFQWQQASALRQLNWLWQIANLWQPLSSEKAAVSLLDPEIMRVEGGVLRLLELRLEKEQPTLIDLGHAWLSWIETAQPQVTEFLTRLCQGLIQGEIHNTELLVGHLDEALAQLSRAQTRRIQISTLTDQGPTRQRNEDACYPPSGTQTSVKDDVLVIVCDGIGGHQGGDVASNLAINTLEQRINALEINRLDSTSLSVELEKAVCAANDVISERNDSENRFDRQRMGTTVVMALVRGHELYITHVGDSRAYWITRRGCHQITLDDDVASREVRLGYSFYRQALHQPSSGSLVQALGMGGSTMLYPTVQRFIPDEDSIFLLCSDGLSDNDRVEEAWESEILPLLDGNVSLTTVSQQLVDIANRRNGYDNVTVGLIRYQVTTEQSLPVLTELPSLQIATTAKPSPAQPLQQTELIAPAAPPTHTESLAESVPTAIIAPRQKASLLPLLMSIGLLLGAGGLLLALLLPTLQTNTQSPDPSGVSSVTPRLATPESRSSTPADPAILTSLEVGTLIQLSRSPQGIAGTVDPPVLISRPPGSPSPATPSSPVASPPPVSPAVPSPAGSPSPTATPESTTVGLLPIGTVLEVLRKQNLSQQDSWVELRVCSTAAGESPELPASPTPEPTSIATPKEIPTPLLQPGQTGWIREAEILPQVTPKTNLTPQQQEACS